MPILLGIIVALIYLVFFVDWKETGGVLKQGGWAAIAVYVVVGVFVTSALTGEATHHAGMNQTHGTEAVQHGEAAQH